jgi:hypothetical protein
MRTRQTILLMTALLLFSHPVHGEMDLATLPQRDAVRITIYKAADLTLVQEQRALTLKEGLNPLRFSWANTLIDPTSLDLLPKAHGDKIQVLDLTFGPRTRDVGLWHVESAFSGRVPMEVTYLSSGLSWRALYLATLSRDEKTMRLESFFRVSNHSGEDYENAEVRLLVGKIHLIDRIADLARRPHPYGGPKAPAPGAREYRTEAEAAPTAELKRRFVAAEKMARARPKEIRTEGLSEYFLYSIEGRETIPNGWAKRLSGFDLDEIPVRNLYRHDERRWGSRVIRFLSFKNDAPHKLGVTPIPGGELQVYRNLGDGDLISYEGKSRFKYIPVGEDVELTLGQADNVIVKPRLTAYKTDQYLFDDLGNIAGWDEIQNFKVEVKNRREIPIKVEITRQFPTPSWDLEKSGDFGVYEKVDKDTVKFTLDLGMRETKRFSYTLTSHHGKRAKE